MILIRGLASLVLAAATISNVAHADDPAAVARRIAASTQLAAQEYRIGVRNGTVVATRKSKKPVSS